MIFRLLDIHILICELGTSHCLEGDKLKVGRVWKSGEVADLSLRLDNQNNVIDYEVADVHIERWY